MEEALRQVGMDVPSWRALMIVHERSPSSVSEIAKRSVRNLSTMTRVVQRLQREDLVKLRHRECDARVTEVLITPRGERAATKVREIAGRIYGIALGNRSSAEVEFLNEILRAIYRNLAEDPSR